MKGYAVVQGARRKVLAIARDTYWCKFIAASELDLEAVVGITGSHHNIDRVLREHDAKIIKIEFELPGYIGGVRK